MSVYNFRDGPSYTAATREEMFTAAMDMPMNGGATFWDQAKGGALESFGLGTAIREAAIPAGETSQLSTMEQLGRTAQTVLPGGVVGAIGTAIRNFTDEPSPVLSEDAYKASPFFRDNVPWDAAMTEQRAAALASWNDAKKVREYFATKRPITAFFGNVAGQAFDPINYIPVVGPSVQAAAAARVGKVIGTAATASADAALNTAIAGIATASARERFGDDVSWQTLVSEVAVAALIGSAFGGIAGAIDVRRAGRIDAQVQERLSTLRTTQEARIALNEGIDAVARGEDITLSPNATAGVDRLMRETPAAQVLEPARQATAAPDQQRAPVAAEQVVDLPVSAEEARLALMRVEYDIQRLTEPGEDVGAIMNAAPVEDAARAVQEQEIRMASRRIEALRSEEPVGNSYGPGLLRNEQAAPTDEVFETGMGGAETRSERAAEVAKAEARLAELTTLAERGEVAREFVQAIEMGRTINPMAVPPARLDMSAPRPEAVPAGRAEAEKTLTRADDYNSLKAQYRVDPDTGDFLESAEIEQLRAEGRLSEEDMATLDAAQAELDNGTAYGDALKAAVACII